MDDKIFFITNLIFSVVGFVMGVCFLTFPMPQSVELKNYRVSLKVLALAYFAIAVFAMLLLFLKRKHLEMELFYFNFLIVTSSQTMLFGFTLTSLLDPVFVTKKKILFHSLPIITLLLLYIFSYYLFGDPYLFKFSDIVNNISQPSVIVRIVTLVYAIFQFFFYLSMFFNAERIYKKNINNYFSDSYKLRLSWVRYALLAGLAIGLLSLMLPLFPNRYFNYAATILFTLFYLVFAIQYINYPNIYVKLNNFFIKEEFIQPEKTTNRKGRLVWSDYKTKIIEQKLFLLPNINIEELAKMLQIGRTTLSNFINTEEKMNFNNWINTLRIEEAKNIFSKNIGLSIAEVSEKVGYTEQSNFSRVFKQIVGETPLIWKKSRFKENGTA